MNCRFIRTCVKARNAVAHLARPQNTAMLAVAVLPWRAGQSCTILMHIRSTAPG